MGRGLRQAGGGWTTLRQLAFVAAVFFALSFWLHFPGLSPNNYTDLMDTLWQRIIHGSGIIPYRDYSLEYPAFSAVVLYASSVWGNMYAYYLSLSLIMFACMVAALFFVHRALTLTGQPLERIGRFIVFTPAFIYFSIYSFDWMGASFMVASIYFAYLRKAKASGAFIGLATAARIIPVVCLPFLLLEFKKGRSRAALLASAASAWLAINAYFMLTDFHGFLYPYIFQAGYNVEDSWIGLFSPVAKPLSAAVLLSLLAVIVVWRKRFTLFQRATLAVLAFVLSSFKFPPQYMILLLPLFALTGVGYVEFMVANVLDVMLILWYFTPVFNLGNPLLVTSPVQWLAMGRQALLAVVFVRLVLLGRREAPGATKREAERIAVELPRGLKRGPGESSSHEVSADAPGALTAAPNRPASEPPGMAGAER